MGTIGEGRRGGEKKEGDQGRMYNSIKSTKNLKNKNFVFNLKQQLLHLKYKFKFQEYLRRL